MKRETVTALGSFSPLNYRADYRKYDDNGNLEIKDAYFGTGESQIYNNYTYTYTTRNMLESETELNRGTTYYEYDKNDNLTKITDPESKSVSIGYNYLDLISSITIGAVSGSRTYSYKYDGNGNMKKSIDPYGHYTFYEYDGYDRLRRVIDPLSNVTIISRADFGNMLTISRFNSDDPQTVLRETVTVNDPLGRMSSYTVNVPGGDDVTYTYGYSDDGKTTVITDSLGRISTVMKNQEGQVFKVIDAAGNSVDYFYEDGRGNMTRKVETEKKPDGTEEIYETKYEYNAFNKIEKIIDPLENETLFTYDEKGNLTGSKDAEDNIISHEYDNFGRKIKTIKHLNSGQKIETKFTYYKNNQLETIEDANGNITRYEYDSQNRTKKIIYPDDTFIEYTYDKVEAGTNQDNETVYYRVMEEKQRKGTVVKHFYDKLQRLMKREITPAVDVEGTTLETYEYDGLSRVTKAENDFTTVEIQYDPLNRVTQETQMGKLIKYTYQNLTESKTVRQTIHYPNQRIIERDFDLLNRISKIREGNTDLASYEYIGRTYRLLNKQYNNGDVINYLYDQGRRLTSKETRNKNSDLINKYVYGYNKVDMKMYEQRGHDSDKGDIYGYDEIYRLKHAKFNSPEPTNPETSLFEKSKTINFDKVDNILSIIESQNQTTNEITTTIEGENAKLNQYTTFDQWGLDYDQNGNMTQKGTQFFTYDYRNQIVLVNDNSDSSTVNYKYDPLGRRIEKSNGTNTVNFYYSGNQVIEERDGSDQVLKQYVYGNGIDEVLRMDKYNTDGSALESSYYYHTNGIGSVTAITDQNGDVVERVSYDLYGMPTIKDVNGDTIENSSIGNEYMFQGRRYDKETNLYYFRSRYYDPIMGRFLQTDPMGYKDSLNLYQAFNMNPANFVDPMGKWWVTEHQQMIIEMLRGWELQESLNSIFGYFPTAYIRVKFKLSIGFRGISLTELKPGEKLAPMNAWDFWQGLSSGSVWPDAPRGYISLLDQMIFLKDPSTMEMKSHHGIFQFWHFMYDSRYHPSSPKLYISKVINWVVGFIKKGRGLLEKGRAFKGGKYIGIAMHIIQDSFAPSHAARNENMEITRIQDYSAQDPGLHKELGDFKKDNEMYWNAAIEACRTILELILQKNFDEQQIRNELWKIFKYNPNIPNEKIMGGTERKYRLKER